MLAVIRLAGVLVLLFLTDAEAQTARKIPTVGYLSAGTVTSSYYPTLVSGLRDLGYVEGKTIDLEPRHAEEQLERLPALASDLVARHVDVIVVVGGAEGVAAKKGSDRIPGCVP